MRRQKRLLSAVLAFVVAFTLLPAYVAMAADSIDAAAFDLQSLGIMTGDENGDLNLDANLTRAEFAAITVRLMDLETVTQFAPDAGYRDVPADYWAKGEINLLSSLNILNGAGNQMFEPEEEVTLEMAAKIMVNALGYNYPALENGGYPFGFLTQAQKIGLLVGVDQSVTPLSRKEIALMAHNALDIDMMIKSVGEADEYQVVKGETLRNRFRTSQDIQKYTGIVTATIDTYLDTPVSDLSDNEIEINGKIYQMLDKSFKKFFGQNVEFYAKEDTASGREIITTMAPADKNEVFTFDADDIKEVAGKRIQYYLDDKGKSAKSLRYQEDTVLVKNNRPLENWNEGTVSGTSRGLITAIDNDDDGIIEVILIKEYTSAVIDDVNAENQMVYFKDGFTLFGKKYFDLDPQDPELYVTVEDAEGNAVTADQLEQGAVFSAFENAFDNSRQEVIVSQSAVSGTIQQVDEDFVTIEGNEYKRETDNVLGDFRPGDQIKAYLNFRDEIVYAEKETTKASYGFVVGVASTSSLGTETMLRVLIPDTLAERFEEEDNEDGGEATKISKVAGRNKEIREYRAADRLTVAGEKLASADAIRNTVLNRVISFTVNSDDEINKITFPTEVGEEEPGDGSIDVVQAKTYNSYEKTFGKTSGGAFGVTENTLTICVPSNGDSSYSDETYLVDVEMKNGRTYDVKAFDQNPDTKTADLIVIQSVMREGVKGTINTKSKVGFVTDSAISLDEDGEEALLISMLSEGGAHEYKVSKTIEDKDRFRSIVKGELIAYSLDGRDELNNYESLTDGKGLDKNTPVGSSASEHFKGFCGYLIDAEYNTVSNSLNRWVHEFYCGLEPDGNAAGNPYEILKNSGPEVYLYQTRSGAAEYIDIKEVQMGVDKLFISSSEDTVRAIVVIR